MEEDLGDWRIHSVGRIAKDIPAAFPGGLSHKAGAPFYLVTSTRGIGKQPIGFITPSTPALALNISIKACVQSELLKNKIVYDEVLTPEGKGKTVSSENISPLFDYFEQSMMTIIFSYLAIETFCNWEIANNITEPFIIQRNKLEETFTVEELERKLSTEEKIHIVLPSIYRIPSPKGKKVWQDYKKLKHARDSIVHCKSIDQYPNRGISAPIDKDSIYFVLINNDMKTFVIYSILLIKYFNYEENPLPRWMIEPMRFIGQE